MEIVSGLLFFGRIYCGYGDMEVRDLFYGFGECLRGSEVLGFKEDIIGYRLNIGD